MYRKRYWLDSAGRWRDRSNGNRLSHGPTGKVDRRKYRVKPPPAWSPGKKRRKPKAKPQAEPTGILLPHTSPREFASPFRFFLESVDLGHPNTVKTCYLILKRTDTAYITQKNPNGVRVFASKFGDIPLREARVMTLADVPSVYKFDTDWVPHIRALKGANLTRTPAKGDNTRQAIAQKKLKPKGGKRKRKAKRRK